MFNKIIDGIAVVVGIIDLILITVFLWQPLLAVFNITAVGEF